MISARQCENMEVLSEGTVYKKEDRREKLSADGNDVIEEVVNQSLMASLLEYQNSEAERLIRSLAGKVCLLEIIQPFSHDILI